MHLTPIRSRSLQFARDANCRRRHASSCLAAPICIRRRRRCLLDGVSAIRNWVAATGLSRRIFPTNMPGN